MWPQTLNYNMYEERDHLKCDLKCILIQLTIINKERHMAKSIMFLKSQISDMVEIVH
jgi:hypothetical protein